MSTEEKLTDPKVFEHTLQCSRCGLPLADYDENVPVGPCEHPLFEYARTCYFLPGAAMVPDIHLGRTPVGGMQEADGRHLGDALVTIERPFIYHSPTGYEWGYGGSGPADLALNILALFVPPPEAWSLHQQYKFDVIARIPRDGGTIQAESVREWIRDAWKRRP